MAKKSISISLVSSKEQLENEISYDDFEFKDYFKEIWGELNV